MPAYEDASIDVGAQVDASVLVWRGSHIRQGARVGAGTSIGQYVYVGPGVIIGSNCKIQNAALIYEPASLGDGVFIGPRVVLTNDQYPRAVKPDGSPKGPADWTPVGVRVESGASVGAGAVCVAPVRIGEWATVAAGAVVVADVPAFALVAGVPARRIGWVGRAGRRLNLVDGEWRCPATQDAFIEVEGPSGLELVQK